jgi:3-oxoacyl-(acyl-carrier-protein) reductase
MSGRVALVTGGSGGIGQAVVASLADAGHRVAIGFGSDEAGAEKAAARAAESGAAVMTVQIDVSESAAVGDAFDRVESLFGPVELLVNNAGVTDDGLVMRMSDEQWARVLRVNLDGAFHTIRRATPAMVKARFGRIVNVSSVSGLTGVPGQANYAAAKAGLLGLTRSVARELASRKVTCNIVAPGPIATAMTAGLSDARRAEMEAAVPAGRMGTPEEVAGAVTYLCSDAAGYVTGAVVPVDGGLGMGH